MAGGLRFHRHSLIERSLGNYFQDIVLQHSSAHKHTARPMSFLNRLVHRGQRWVSLIFTGLILSGALYLILAPLPPAPAAKPKTAEEIEEVESWTKTELFGFLSRVSLCWVILVGVHAYDHSLTPLPSPVLNAPVLTPT